jgi:hypothetical protein
VAGNAIDLDAPGQWFGRNRFAGHFLAGSSFVKCDLLVRAAPRKCQLRSSINIAFSYERQVTFVVSCNRNEHGQPNNIACRTEAFVDQCSGVGKDATVAARRIAVSIVTPLTLARFIAKAETF